MSTSSSCTRIEETPEVELAPQTIVLIGKFLPGEAKGYRRYRFRGSNVVADALAWALQNCEIFLEFAHRVPRVEDAMQVLGDAGLRKLLDPCGQICTLDRLKRQVEKGRLESREIDRIKGLLGDGATPGAGKKEGESRPKGKAVAGSTQNEAVSATDGAVADGYRRQTVQLLKEFPHLNTVFVNTRGDVDQLRSEVSTVLSVLGRTRDKADKDSLMQAVENERTELVNRVEERVAAVRRAFEPCRTAWATLASILANADGTIRDLLLIDTDDPESLLQYEHAHVYRMLQETGARAFDILVCSPISRLESLNAFTATYLGIKPRLYGCLYVGLAEDDFQVAAEIAGDGGSSIAEGHLCVYCGVGEYRGTGVLIVGPVFGMRRRLDAMWYPDGRLYGPLTSSFGVQSYKALLGVEALSTAHWTEDDLAELASKGVNSAWKVGQGMYAPYRAATRSRQPGYTLIDPTRFVDNLVSHVQYYLQYVIGEVAERAAAETFAEQARDMFVKPYEACRALAVDVKYVPGDQPSLYQLAMAATIEGYFETARVIDVRRSHSRSTKK